MKNEITISVMGPKIPCNNCRNTRKTVFRALAEYEQFDLKVTIQHLELNTKESIAKMGVLRGPVLIFDDMLVYEGKIPSKSEIKQALKQYLAL